MVPTLLVALALAAAAAAQDGLAADLAPQRDFLEFYCFDCHGGEVVKGGLDLRVALADDVERLSRLSHLRARVAAGEMPPSEPDDPGSDAVPAEERAPFLAWIDGVLWREVPGLSPDPGQTTIRRLNSAQWQRTVRDLFGVTVSTASFPPDDLGYGFATVGDAMSFATLHLEKYLAAAGGVAERVLTGEDPDLPTVRRLEAEAMAIASGTVVGTDGEHANLLTRATLEQVVRVPRDGRFLLRVSARATQAGTEVARMRVQCGAQPGVELDVPGDGFAEYETEIALARGEHRLALTFLNDYYDPKHPDPKQRDRNLQLDWCEVVGPLDPSIVPPEQRWLHEALTGVDGGAARVRALAGAVLPRAWRRPVDPDEVARYAAIGEAALAAGDDATTAQRVVLQAALTSPHFLFRGEVGGVAAVGEGEVAPVPSVVLASRLSYFLWASAPDARLLELGVNGELADRAVLRAAARRLLADPRADSLATEFCAQWFEVANLAAVTPDPDRFPGFDDELRRSLAAETEQLFLAVLREDRDVRELLDCDHTFLDRRAAQFYGIALPDGVAGDRPVRVELPAGHRQRGGVLGHAAILAVTSNPTRTSPVKRGKWILENVLGAPPPPPPVAAAFANEAAIDSSGSLREQLAQHRASRECAVCHVRMDALGFALERFDAVGRYRERDAGGVIDASGRLPDGRQIDGLAELKQVLGEGPGFVGTFARKLFVYGIGRDPRPVDRLKLDHAVERLLRAGKVTVADLVLAIVDSDAFRLWRRARRNL